MADACTEERGGVRRALPMRELKSTIHETSSKRSYAEGEMWERREGAGLEIP